MLAGEHQHELLDFVAAKFHEEMGVFKLLVRCFQVPNTTNIDGTTCGDSGNSVA